MNYKIETIGCQMNVCESDIISEFLQKKGWQDVKDINQADIIILNTCSVRAQAEQKAFSFLGRAEELKQEKTNVKIVVIGCMAQRISQKIKKRFTKIDLIMGTDKTPVEIAAKIEKLSVKNTDDIFTNSGNDKKKKLDGKKIVGYFSIMKGCDNFCSYCVVPFVRGREKSFDDKIIFDKCFNFIENGGKEIMLLGQNVNSYNYNGLNFSGLIKKLASIDGLERIRFMTNHPKDLSDELIETIAAEPKVCKHIHLPMQSACDKILEKMNRKYTYAHYLDLIKKLREKIKNISVTTDIIAGFPGESKKDFDDTIRAVKEIRFGGLYAFRYSPRPDTKAANFDDDISLDEKQERLSAILAEGNEISAQITSEMKGKIYKILTDRYENGFLEGRTTCGRKVLIKGDENNFGKILDVLIKEVKVNALFGEIV